MMKSRQALAEVQRLQREKDLLASEHERLKGGLGNEGTAAAQENIPVAAAVNVAVTAPVGAAVGAAGVPARPPVLRPSALTAGA